MRMQFWHSKRQGRNEFLKYVFRLWWVGTKETQQVTLRAHAVRAMVPWALPRRPLALPPWNFSRQSSSCREAFEGFLMAHSKCVFSWWRRLWHIPCSKQSRWLGLLMGDGERGPCVRGEVGATPSVSSTGHICDRNKPAGHGLLLNGLESTVWIVQSVPVVRGIRP